MGTQGVTLHAVHFQKTTHLHSRCLFPGARSTSAPGNCRGRVPARHCCSHVLWGRGARACPERDTYLLLQEEGLSRPAGTAWGEPRHLPERPRSSSPCRSSCVRPRACRREWGWRSPPGREGAVRVRAHHVLLPSGRLSPRVCFQHARDGPVLWVRPQSALLGHLRHTGTRAQRPGLPFRE